MNKKEIKRTAVRRRGTTLAAAALSIAMVGPFVHAVTPASPFTAVANAQENQPAAEAPAPASDQAIYSPGQADQKSTISGSVKEIVEAAVGFGDVQDSGKPLAGVKVYAQWYEGENTQHSSPVYYTESDENGNFTIKMAPYTDALGATRYFDADASAGLTTGADRGKRDHRREKIRVWTELPENLTDKYRLVHQPAAGIFPGIGANTTPTTQGDGTWGGNKITGMTIQYAQKDKLPQHLPENKWAQNEGRNNNHGVYAGQAFWNLDVLQGALNHNTVSAFGGKDVPAAGMKVVGSYLNDQAVTKIEEYAKNNFAGKTLRGRGWTPADEAGLQKWINEQVVADPEGWIAETVHTTTAADGTFKLYWKGLYGNNHTGTGGGINPPADKLHKLAGSWSEGSWLNGNRESKHINMDWSYVAVYGADGKPLPDNIGALYPWALGQWAGPSSDGGNAQLFGGDGNKILYGDDVYANWNIALAPQALKFDVVDKNTTDNWATVGDKVQTDTAGLPIADNLNYYIEWVDKNGNVVKTCETAKPDSATKIPSCELDVPADAQTGDTFTARLKVTQGNPDPANDLVLAMDAFAVARDYLEYAPVDAKRGEEATSTPKFDNPDTDAKEEKPEKAKFELGKLPDGVTEDQVKVDPATGVVTFTPTAEQAGKTFNFPVVMRDEDLKVPVLDDNGDPVKDESGNPKTQGRIVARADAPFKVEEATPDTKQNETFEPGYEDGSGKPGSDVKVDKPVFKDKDGKETKAPEGTKFTPGENVPDGVTIDENTGEITVTIPEDAKPGDKITVPVVVTYPDGSTDEKTVTVTVEEPDAPETPDAKDNESYEPEYNGGTGKPGDDVKIDKPEFKDKDNKVVDAPAGTKFTPGENVPDGVTIDENTGEITVKVPEDAKPGDKITVPVVVTYPDGSTDEVDVTVTVTEKDATPVTPVAPTENNPSTGASADDPASCEEPPYVTVEETEGVEYKVTVDGKELTPDADGKYVYDYGQTVKVEAFPTEGFTFPEGAQTTWTYTTQQNEVCDAPDTKQNENFEPGYEDGSGKPGEDVTVPAPEFKDKDKNPTEAPDGTTFKPGDNAPDGVTVDENTGEITVTVPEDAKPGDKITVPVEVTYPDGSKDNVDVTVTVEQPDAPEQPDTKTADEVEPEYEDGSGKPGKDVTVPAPEFKDKDKNPTEAPDGTTFKPGDNAPDGVTVDENTGEITVTVPEDAKPGDKITVPVEVTYPDGSKDNVDVTVTVEQPDAPEQPDTKTADEVEPEYEDGSGKPGKDVTVPAPEFKDKDKNPTEAPDGTTFKPGDNAPDGVTVDENTGEITVTVPEDAKPGDKITVPVEVTYPDGSKDNVDVTVTVEQPDAPEQPDTKTADEVEPEYEDGSGKPGKDVTVPAPEFKDKDKNPTEAPDGTTFKPGDNAPDGVTVDENTGEITVTVPEDAKPGDKITVPVEVTYPDGSKDNVDVTVTVEQPDAPAEKPDWTNDKGKPGEKVEIPNTGGPVEDGTKVETEGPGKAKIDEKGKLIVDVDKDAKPGQKVVVVVKDKDGNEIDRVVVEVEQPGGSSDGSGSSDLSSKDNQRCINTGLGVGIPLLFLIPVGLASQMNIPGLSDFVAPINKQIRDLNTQLQKQAGVFNGPLAGKMAGIDAQLKRFGVDHQQAAGAVALIAAGALAIGLIADACAPGAGSSNGSSSSK